MHGVSANFTAEFQKKAGVRLTTTMGAACYAAGWSLFALGVHLHMLPLCYLGYSFIAGSGLGLSYALPIVNLFNWFPDKKAFAAGIATMGFGGSAMISGTLIKEFLDKFSKAPSFAGAGDISGQIVGKEKLF